MQIVARVLILALLAGCAEFQSGWNGLNGRYAAGYGQPDFDELLDFGANMANISPSARAKVCRTLTTQNRSASVTIKLFLLSGRLFSNSCGDISRILSGVAAIPPSALRDERVRKLVAIQSEALKRLEYPSLRPSYAEPVRKTGPSNPKRSDERTSKPDESRLLREKLEAIRSMEKQMDQSDDLP
ncbi:MAG: hypothetical protein ACU843_15710 [Gammaproteobacteria bacterium]